jgi:hypothetical protein
MTCAELRLLSHKTKASMRKSRFHAFSIVTSHDRDGIGRQGFYRLQDMFQKRAIQGALENFRSAAFHARSLARGEDESLAYHVVFLIVTIDS